MILNLKNDYLHKISTILWFRGMEQSKIKVAAIGIVIRC